MTIDAVVFDLDGTLADTLEDIAAAMNYALGRQSLPGRPADEYRELVGEGVRRWAESPGGCSRVHLAPKSKNDAARSALG